MSAVATSSQAQQHFHPGPGAGNYHVPFNSFKISQFLLFIVHMKVSADGYQNQHHVTTWRVYMDDAASDIEKSNSLNSTIDHNQTSF